MHCSLFLLSFLVLALINGSEVRRDEHERNVRGLSLVKREIGDDQWNQWSIWGRCSKSCGGGIQTRTRTCRVVQFVNRSLFTECRFLGQSGFALENKPCNQELCLDQWTQWSQWSCCANNYEQSRTRTCPGGDACSGLPSEKRRCGISSWSDCSVTCGDDGQQTLIRTCLGGTDCPNLNTDHGKRPCQPQPPSCYDWSWTKCWDNLCSGSGENRSCNVENVASCYRNL